MHERFPLLSAGVIGASGVFLGAVGEHGAGLRQIMLDHGTAHVWETAVQYQLFHGVALLGMAGWMRPVPHGAAAHRATQAVRFWTWGTALFSGSLYLLALGGPRLLGWVTPIGGLALIAGWVLAAGAAVAPRSEYDL
jgi:uncharacterized membrane protein YgdD (TMEM256/DUF423 family)